MAKKEKDDDEKLIPVTDEEGSEGGETVVVDEEARAAAEAEAAKAAAAEDERVGQSEDDDDPSDEEAANEEVRARRREERRVKKERQRAAQERNQKELRFLRDRNAELERRFSAVEQRTLYNEAGSIDDRISQVDQQIRNADELIAQAIEKGEGSTFAEAQAIRDQLRESKNKLLHRKGQVAQEFQRGGQAQQQGQAQPRQEQTDPELVRRAQAWVSQNSWYKADRSDDDSAVVGALDDRLVSEGFDPTTDEYWTELTNRAKQHVPHRFQEAKSGGNGGQRQQNGTERRGPQMANGNRERSLRPGEVYVSPERRQAMVEAGVWDDPTLRNRYLKSYATWDKEAQGSN
jgi:hypothetical protein